MNTINTEYKDWLENQIELCFNCRSISEYEYQWIRSILVSKDFNNESVALINDIMGPDMNGNPIF